MPDKFIGRRDQNADEWRWLPVPIEESKPDFVGRNLRRNLLLAAVGASLMVVGVVLIVVLANDSANEQPPPSSAGPATASAGGGGTTTVTASATPQATATAQATATVTTPPRTPPPIGDVRIFVWRRQDQQWLDSDNVKDEPGYAEGETVPFMLQLMGTSDGAVYDVTIEYQCRTPAGAAFDHLATVSDEKDSAASMTPPVPQRREDASIPVPDDPSIAFDGPGRLFRAWDASFENVAESPLPEGTCESTKRVSVSLLAQGPNAFLIWGGHLASESDWGQGQGASSQPAPIDMAVSVNGSETKELGVAPDAITP